mgnify:CR=1 FL=1
MQSENSFFFYSFLFLISIFFAVHTAINNQQYRKNYNFSAQSTFLNN